MNQYQIQQLTSHLSQALDQNYDVINMDAVLSVICALEGTKITKEQLEATRLAKYINQLRRRTTNEHLARRAKSLLKKWREMVGIQQTTFDSQQQHQSQSIEFLKSTTSTPPFDEIVSLLPISSSLPSQEIFPDIHLNIDRSETPSLSVNSQANSNLSSTHNNIKDLNRRENNSTNSVHSYNRLSQNMAGGPVNPPQQHLINQSLNTISNKYDVSKKKLNEVSVVIDIVSDSDDNDNNSAKLVRSDISEPSLLMIPSTPSPRLKKNMKDKKNDHILHRPNKKISKKNKDGFLHTTPADSEVFSTSNSSMSSILSGDTTLGNSGSKTRTNSSELTFSGRFKSINQVEVLSQNNFTPFSGNNNASSHINELDKPLFEDYNTYDSSASCSRFSSSVDQGKSEKIALQIHRPVDAQCPVLNKTELFHKASDSHGFKKRGRKKGSRVVDAVISKESSSLCQQIFLGSSTVKKVKTTKELFNEIQSRKLTASHSSTFRDETKCARLKRRTSSCSVINKQECKKVNCGIQNSFIFFYFTESANTDSDTTDHFSNKSLEVKECTSLDSNSCSRQTSSFVHYSKKLTSQSFNDITTQLMHLINSFGSPISVHEMEKSYQVQFVPCSCIIFENDINLLRESKLFTPDDQGNIIHSNGKYNGKLDRNTKEILRTIEQPIDKDDTQPKPKKSIFDLDFEDEDDPLKSLMNAIQKPVGNKETEKILTPQIFTNKVLMSLGNTNIDAQLDSFSQEIDDELPKVVESVFTIKEDPECLAKKRFYVQTNKVNGFHINALHNYYIPNINGNWDSIDESISFKSINDFVDSLDSYTVTNGSDVVPQYGFLKYDYIRKDLSSFKFLKPYKVKSFQKDFSPFLGVAKCLPTCRNYKRKAIDRHGSADQILKKNKLNRAIPLQIDTEIPISDMISYNNSLTYIKEKDWSNYALNDSFDSCHVSAFSNNLLKLANEKDVHERQAVHLKSQDNFSPICKNSSNVVRLQNMSYIGKNKTQISKQEKNRKRRGSCGGKKLYSEENTDFLGTTKRNKFRLSGTINDRLSGNNSSENDDTINDIDVEQHGKNEYEIVQPKSSDGGVASKHIVLTIKKTPKILSETEMLKRLSYTPNLNISSLSNSLKELPFISKESKLPIRPRNRHLYRQTIRKSYSRKSNTVDLDLKHWFCFKHKVQNSVKKKRVHKELFFEDELLRENLQGRKQKIMNYSSSSSSFDDSDLEYIAVEKNVDKKIMKDEIDTRVLPVTNIKNKEDPSLCSDEDKDMIAIHSTSEIGKNQVDEYEVLNMKNNGMLLSFNSIVAQHCNLVDNLNSVEVRFSKENSSLDVPQKELNNLCNINENISVSSLTASDNVNNSKVALGQDKPEIGASLNYQKCRKPVESFKSAELLSLEHRIGIRLSKNNSDNVVKSTKIQKFKEWHQVLQLKSYNDEPLIVMPYVVLE
ncbi:hypothetical protein KR067_001753 [Drosophila pandora]|nr:hypothetical protein KR067_001753 [Drosophila pandora]